MKEHISYILSYINYIKNEFLHKILKSSFHKKKIIKKKIMTSKETHSFYDFLFLNNKPFMVGRIGTVESQAIDHQIRLELGFEKKIPDRTMDRVCNNAGFFPNDKKLLKQFKEEYINSITSCDMIASWSNNEQYLFKKYCPEAHFCHLRDIEPEIGNPNSWIKYLAGKKILVVHPFAETIKKQYSRKDLVFSNGFLPEFNLVVIKAVQTIAGNSDNRFKTWFDALNYMKQQISLIDFDIALIGCGAYGFPLAAYVKTLGKKAIQTAGSTQIIFGILGKRWENKDYLQPFINKYWVRPSDDEVVKNKDLIEGGCYW